MLLCQDGSYYIGWTNDLDKRYTAHCNGVGAKYTKAHPPKEIAYYETYENKLDALRREFYLKQYSHQEKEKLARGINVAKNAFIPNNIKKRRNKKHMNIYRCKHCGNIIVKLHDSNVPVQCCGEDMELLVANTTDAAQEKHVPSVKKDGQSIAVTVGSVEHPMQPEHYIEWILIETKKGYQVQFLNPGGKPTATFTTSEEVVAIYEYCNLHGLWKA